MNNADALVVAQFHHSMGLKRDQPIDFEVLGDYTLHFPFTYDGHISIKASAIATKLDPYVDNRSVIHREKARVYVIPMFLVNNVAYRFDYPYSGAGGEMVCGNDSSTYQWGFSPPLVMLFALLNGIPPLLVRSGREKLNLLGVWILGTYITWIHTIRLKSGQINRTGRSSGPYRAALDVSEAIREELGDNLSAYNDSEIAKTLEKRPPIKYVVTKAKAEHSSGEPVWHLGVSSSTGDRDLDFKTKALYG